MSLTDAFDEAVRGGAEPGEKLRELVAQSHAGSPWFELAELLFVFAHLNGEGGPAFERIDIDNPIGADAPGSAGFRARQLFQALDDQHMKARRPDPDTTGKLADLLVGQDLAILAEAAIAIAEAIAAHRYQQFEDFWSESPRTLVHGRAFPEAFRNPKHLLGRTLRPNSEPSNLPPDFGRVKGIRLARRVARSFDFQVHTWPEHLSKLAEERPLVIATCHPNYANEEFRVPYDASVGQMWFRNEGPINRPRQLSLLRRQMLAAAKAGATVVVIPEYALHPDDRPKLREFFEGMPEDRQPLLVVAGSGRVAKPEGSANHFNEAAVWIGSAGRPPATERVGWEQDKLYPAPITYPVPEFPRRSPRRFHESVSRGRAVQVIRTRKWVVAVLVCRDAMEHELVNQLADLGVNLCIVPCYTPHSASIAGSLAALRTRSQAVTVIASAPALMLNEPVRDVAFDGPFEQETGAVQRWSNHPDRTAGPGIWVWTPSPSSAPRWIPTPTYNRSPTDWLREFARLVNERLVLGIDATVSRLMALHAYPATGRFWNQKCQDELDRPANPDLPEHIREQHNDELKRYPPFESGDLSETLRQLLEADPPAFEPRILKARESGTVAVLQFTWTRPTSWPGTMSLPGGPVSHRQATWTVVLTQQPDGGWLCLFHDTLSPERTDGQDAHTWQDHFVRWTNQPQVLRAAGMAEESDIDTSVAQLLEIYAPTAVYMHEPGRAVVGNPQPGPVDFTSYEHHRAIALGQLSQGWRAVLKRRPTFTIQQGTTEYFGTLALQTCC